MQLNDIFLFCFYLFWMVLSTAVLRPAKDKLQPPFLRIGLGNLK